MEDVWYEVQDLRVAEVLPQMVALSETYMQARAAAGWVVGVWWARGGCVVVGDVCV